MLKRLPRLGRFTAMLLVALWGLQPLETLLHSEAHAHRYCAEHQAFEEAALGAQQQTLSALGQGLLLSARTAVPADPSLLPHETCPLLGGGSRQEALANEARATSDARLATSRPATAPPLRGHSSLPLLATAPKSSPPPALRS